MILAVFILTGIFAGILSGWIGAGGGIIIVPVMLFLTAREGIDPSLAVHLSITTSLAFIMVNSIYTTFHHHKNGHLLFPLFKRIVIFVIMGALVGSQLDLILPSLWPKVIFIALMLVVLVQSFLQKHQNINSQHIIPGVASRASIGLLIGTLSAIVGVGGSTITNPYMLHYKYPMKQCAAMSTALAIPMGFFAISTLMVHSIGMSSLPSGSVGFIYIPAFVGLLIGSFIGSPLGVFIVKRVSNKFSIWFFRCVLFAVLVQMFYSVYSHW